MSTASPYTRDLARRLVAVEVAREGSPFASGAGAVRVCEKLRLPLVKLAGVAGFRSLLARAVALARGGNPSLAVQVRPDGSLDGLDGSGTDSDAAGRSGVDVVAELLGLLVTFIGEPLTRHLVRDAWPNASAAGTDAGSGEGS